MGGYVGDEFGREGREVILIGGFDFWKQEVGSEDLGLILVGWFCKV